MSVLGRFTLYLSSEGTSFEIENFLKSQAPIPYQQEALACNSHETALAFLEKLKDSSAKESFNFYHDHNFHYAAHQGSKKAHLCSLENQIDFIKYKISERKHGPRKNPWCLMQ